MILLSYFHISLLLQRLLSHTILLNLVSAMPALHSREVSSDNTVNIVFGLASVIIGIVTITFGWLMWKLKKRHEGRSPHMSIHLHIS